MVEPNTRPLEVTSFRSMLADVFGWRFDDNKDEWLQALLHRRLQACQLSAADYLGRLRAGGLPQEANVLAAELTVAETSFFRNIEQFRVLDDVVLPAMQAQLLSKRTLRMLSAACASGEEPYSLAMWLHDRAVRGGWCVHIDAFDLNPSVLKLAREGQYSEWSLRDTPEHLRQRWFVKQGQGYELDEGIRAQVQFDVRNLVAEDARFWPAASYDVIFCRNVLMYLTPAHMASVVQRLSTALAPGGFLFLGYAEALRVLPAGLTLCQSHATYYYRQASTDTTAGALATPERAAPGRSTSSDVDRDVAAMPAPEPYATRPRPMSSNLAQAHELFASKHFDAAWSHMQASPEHLHGLPVGKRLQVMLLVQQGEHEQAQAMCHHMASHGELTADAHHILALCHAGRGDVAAALAAERTAADLDPAFAMPHLQTGLLSRRHGDDRLARHELEVALLLLPHEEGLRVSLYGGGFSRQALLTLCQAELRT